MWQPIETIPDNVTEADVWTDCSAFPLRRGNRHPNAQRRDGIWYDCGGNVLNWSGLDADGEPHYRKVTHWTPLPEPPTEESRDESRRV